MELNFIFIAIIFGALVYYLNRKEKIALLKRNGVRVTGTIISNKDGEPQNFYRLGGNINRPTIRFMTKTREEITSKPVVGFITQHKVVVGTEVYILYDPENPQRFCVSED